MPKTPTEILAEALFGWKFERNGFNFKGKIYSLNGKHANIEPSGEAKFDSTGNWPTFDPDHRESEWWMKQVEHELKRRGLDDRYWQSLLNACPGQISSTNALLLPLETRVQAAVKVLEVGK